MECAGLSPVHERYPYKHRYMTYNMDGQCSLIIPSVLPYFAASPFFDAMSNNATLTTQALNNPNMFYIIQTRADFEARLKTMQGLEFIVTHDPSENDTKIPNSGVWVIRKQIRRKRQAMPDDITPISSYYVVNENVYMAPSVVNIIGSRMVRNLDFLNILKLKHAPAVYSYLPYEINCRSVFVTYIYACNRSHIPTPCFEEPDRRSKFAGFANERSDLAITTRKHAHASNTRYCWNGEGLAKAVFRHRLPRPSNARRILRPFTTLWQRIHGRESRSGRTWGLQAREGP